MRTEFERQFPVAEGVVWGDERERYESLSADEDVIDSLRIQNSRWQGFQSGYAAALERTADLCYSKAEPEKHSSISFGWPNACYELTKAIRALDK